MLENPKYGIGLNSRKLKSLIENTFLNTSHFIFLFLGRQFKILKAVYNGTQQPLEKIKAQILKPQSRQP